MPTGIELKMGTQTPRNAQKHPVRAKIYQLTKLRDLPRNAQIRPDTPRNVQLGQKFTSYVFRAKKPTPLCV